MRKREIFVLIYTLGLFYNAHLTAQKVVQPKLTPTEWWTASYKELFADADIIYALHPQVAYKILDIIVNRATQDAEPKLVFTALRRKGLYLERQLAFQEALDNYSLAAKAIENKDSKQFAVIQIDIAIMHRKLYHYIDARTVYVSLIDYSNAHNDSENVVNAYCGLGVLFFTINDYKNAIRYYEKALEKSREMHDYAKESVYLDNLSEAYGCLKEYDKAFEHIVLACQIAEKQKDTVSLIPLYERYARLYAEVGDFTNAFIKIDKGLALSDDYDRNILIKAFVKSPTSAYKREIGRAHV